MASLIEKLRRGDLALDAERRSMNKALARLSGAQTNISTATQPVRLMIGLDLTGSRAAGLKQARIAMASMLDVVRNVGKVTVKVVYFCGYNEFYETQWFEDMDALARILLRLSCITGLTQIREVLERTLREPEKLSALIFIGDDCEEDQPNLLRLARELAVPMFIFHECANHNLGAVDAEPIFRQMAEATGGAYTEFKPDKGAALKEMLSTIAAFSAGGTAALNKLALVTTTAEARQLQSQLLLGSGNATKGAHR